MDADDQEHGITAPVINFTLPPRLVPTTDSASTTANNLAYSPFTNTLLATSQSSRRNSLSKNNSGAEDEAAVNKSVIRSSRIDSTESGSSSASFSSATAVPAAKSSNKASFIGSLTVASGQTTASSALVVDRRPSARGEQEERFVADPTTSTTKSQSMYELTSNKPSGLAATIGVSSRRSSQNSNSSNNANENLTSHTLPPHYNHHQHQKAMMTGSAKLPPSGVHSQQQLHNHYQQQHNVQQLQTEISIKDEMLKSQTVQLVETHRRQAELEEQLAFFKIDAKFDSVANILLNSPRQNNNKDNNQNNNEVIIVRNAHSPLPPAPYIGKSPFKLVLSADPTAFRRENSSLDANSVREDVDPQQRPNSSAEDLQNPLIIGLSREFTTSLRRLQAEINRVAGECQSVRKNCDQFDFARIEQSSDRLDDDIEICRSRLSKLRQDVPTQMSGSLSLNSLFDSLYSSLSAARNDLNIALRQKEEQTLQQSVAAKPPLPRVEPSPLFIAALNENQPPPPPVSPSPSTKQKPQPHRFLQETHRFQSSVLAKQPPSVPPVAPDLNSTTVITKNQSFVSNSEVELPDNREDIRDDSSEILTRQLLSRLGESEEVQRQYKSEIENLKARLDTMTPRITSSNGPELDHPLPPAVVTSTPKRELMMPVAESPATVIGRYDDSISKVDKGTETIPERPKKVVEDVAPSKVIEKPPKPPPQDNHANLCSLSFDAAASAYKLHLSGLDRRLDTHENFVLNAFGTLLDRYVLSPKVTNPENRAPPPVQPAHPIVEPVPPIQVQIQQPQPVMPTVEKVLVKARAVQVNASEESELETVETMERERRARKRASLLAKRAASADSNHQQVQQEVTEYSKNFEQIFVHFKSDIENIKATFLETMQEQQMHNAQQLAQLQQNLVQQQLEHQQLLEQQQQKRESTPQPEEPPPASPTRQHHHHHHHSHPRSLSRHRPRSVADSPVPQIADLAAFSGIVNVAEETLQTLTSNKNALAEQISHLELKRVAIEEDVNRLGLECNQMQESSSRYEMQIQYLAVELASKQQELVVVDELIADARRVLSDLNARTGELQSKFDLLQSTAEQHRVGLETIVSRSTSAKTELAQLEHLEKQVGERVLKSKAELELVEKLLADRRSELNSLNETVESVKNECDIIVKQRESFLADSAEMFSEHSQLTELLVQLNAERQSLVAQIEAARESLLVLDTHSLAKQQECDQNQRAMEDFMDNLTALIIRRDTLQNEVESVEKRLMDLQSLLNQCSEQKRTLRYEIDNLESTKSELLTEVESMRRNRFEPSVISDQTEVRALERKLADAERQLAEEKSKSGHLDVVAKERQDEVGRLVGQLLVVHADYLNLHRQLRRMNATFDGSAEVLNLPAAFQPSASQYQYAGLGGSHFRESSPDLVVASTGIGGTNGLMLTKSNQIIDRPSSSGSSANSNPIAMPNQGQKTGGKTSGASSGESGYSSIA